MRCDEGDDAVCRIDVSVDVTLTVVQGNLIGCFGLTEPNHGRCYSLFEPSKQNKITVQSHKS